MMVWQDLLLDCWVDEETLARALATVFELEPTAVLVVDDIAAPALEVGGIAVLAERTRRRGQFPLQVSVYVRDAVIWQRVGTFDQTIRVVRQLCGLLQCSCLIAGDDSEPDEDVLVRPGGEVLRVTLDDARLAGDEFVVIASEPLEPAARRMGGRMR